MSAAGLQQLLALADGHRHAQRWAQAIAAYRQLTLDLADHALVHHNLALCLLSAGQPEAALTHADQALLARNGQPGVWQSGVLKVRALVQLGRAAQAYQLLVDLRQRFPERPEFTLELATLTLHQVCDARAARALVKPLMGRDASNTDATLTDLMASLYDRDEDAACLNDRVKAFASAKLQRPRGKLQSEAPPKNRQRKRLGLLSPHFNCSPVYFFCSGALRLLANEFDLYFFSRSDRSDWATAELKTLATAWFDLTHLSAQQIDDFIRQHALDVLVDLGGWMDPIALMAISSKPARRMYKWVGGQSITTGLNAFDGFITDQAQTPAGFEAWFTEPLIRLPHGYVSYTPPAYLPAPVPASTGHHVLGVVANPVKVSQPFLADLGRSLVRRARRTLPLELRFIDKRYAESALQERVREALAPAIERLGQPVALRFVAPVGHLAYLQQVGQLSEMLDTFPYTGGLTTMEALSLGVPCSAKAGNLFCERHTHAHLHYIRPHGERHAAPRAARPGAARKSLIPPNSQRTDHVALARSLVQLFGTGRLAKAAP